MAYEIVDGNCGVLDTVWPEIKTERAEVPRTKLSVGVTPANKGTNS